MDQNFSGLSQPGVNLGGLLNMAGLSGDMASMSGTQAGQGGAGMSPGMDLAEMLQMMGEGEGQSAVGLGQPLGSTPLSIAQQQAGGGPMMPNLGQPSYLTAGANGGGGGMMMQGGQGASVDPLAIIQKVLGLAQKGVQVTGNSGTSLMGASGGGEFDPEGQMQTEGFQQYRSGERGDFSQLDAFRQMLQQFPTPGAGLTDEISRGLAPPSDVFNPNFMGGAQGPDTTMLAGMEDIPSDGFTALSGGGGGGLGFNPTFGNTLGVLGGLAGLAGGIQSGNPYGIAGGAIGTAANTASMLGNPALGGVIGGVAGPLSLASGIQSKNPTSIASGALQTYQSLSALFPQYFTPLSELSVQALTAVAPEFAASLGLTAGGGASAAGLGAGSAAAGGSATTGATAGGLAAGETLGATGSAAGSAATGGASLAGAVALPLALAAIGYGIWSKQEADQMEGIYRGMKETIARRGALPENVQSVVDAFNTMSSLQDFGSLSDQDLVQRYQTLNASLPAMNNVHALINAPSSAPSRIPRMDTTELRKLADVYTQSVPFGIAAFQDEFARRGTPMDQFFKPLSDTDFMGLAGPYGVTPEQLAGIGPGNMLAALQAVRNNQPLTGLPQAVPGVAEARLSAAQADLPFYSGIQYAPYFLNAEQRAQLSAREQAYPVEMQTYGTGGQTEGGSSFFGPPPQTPFQLYQQMLGMYQIPQAPQDMFAPPQAPMAPGPAPVEAVPTGGPTPVPVTPQSPQQQLALQQMLMMLMGGGGVPSFGAQGNEDPAPSRMFSQYT